MTPRENLLSLYRRRGYEFVPVELSMCPDILAKMRQAMGEDGTLGQYFGYEHGFSRVRVRGPEIIKETPVDWRKYYTNTLDPITDFSAYGVAHEGGHAGTFHMRRMHHPMATFDSIGQMQEYPWPVWDFDDISAARAEADSAHAEGIPVFADMACTVWESSWYIRGMTELMTDMALDDEKATFILDKITEDSSRRAAAYARADADVLCLGDDIGMQKTIMMSLDMYREWLKPRLAKVIAAARAEKPDIIVHYHSCGFVEPYIPDLIEVGVDVLNPIQPECMDFAEIHGKYGDSLSFNGTIGTQTTMPFGSPDDVRKTTLRNLKIAGEEGGLLPCPTHILEPEVPWENIEAYIKACKEFKG
ncbi:MAG: hypothetical protein JW808_11910 [Victivallales bacterium]|nr:hypothetical protein [Victivallales bacterium]